MFKLIKFFFWVCSIIILAYFLSDVRWGDRTLKQNVDDFLRSETGIQLKIKFKQWIMTPLGEWLDTTPAPRKAKEQAPSARLSPARLSPAQPQPARPQPGAPSKPSEGISNADRNQLKGIIENSTKGEKK